MTKVPRREENPKKPITKREKIEILASPSTALEL